MELIRRNSDYALRALSLMARYPKGKRFTVEEIAKRERVPTTFLRKVFQNLSSDNILDSKPGRRGGYYLIKNPFRISVRDVIESVQGRVSLSDCLIYNNVCGRQTLCRIRKKLYNVQQKLEALLNEAKLGEID